MGFRTCAARGHVVGDAGPFNLNHLFHFSHLPVTPLFNAVNGPVASLLY
jgi:hypothetical protein